MFCVLCISTLNLPWKFSHFAQKMSLVTLFLSKSVDLTQNTVTEEPHFCQSSLPKYGAATSPQRTSSLTTNTNNSSVPGLPLSLGESLYNCAAAVWIFAGHGNQNISNVPVKYGSFLLRIWICHLLALKRGRTWCKGGLEPHEEPNWPDRCFWSQIWLFLAWKVKNQQM